MRDPTICASLGKPESKLQTWSSSPNSSGRRNWPKEEFVQSVDLRVDGIPNDETYKDEQYMQRIAEQVQKLENTERISEAGSPKYNILSEKAAKKIHEAGSCELHEIQQRTGKVQCQLCFSFIEAGFQVCQKKCFPAKDKILSNSLQRPT